MAAQEPSQGAAPRTRKDRDPLAQGRSFLLVLMIATTSTAKLIAIMSASKTLIATSPPFSQE